MGSSEEKALLHDVQLYLAIKKEKENEGSKTIEGEQAFIVHEHIKQIISSQLTAALGEKGKLLEPEKSEIMVDSQLEEDSQNSLSQLLRENFIDPIVYFHAIQSIFRKYNYILTDRDI